MRFLRSIAFATAAGILAGSSGCHSFWERKNESVAPALGASASTPAELPPGESAKVCLTTAEALEKGGKDREAIGLYEKARVIDPNLKQVARKLGVLYDRTLQHDKAKAEFDKALALRPHDADILTDFGYGFYTRGLWSEAEKYLRQAIVADPKHVRAWTNLGMTLGQREQYDDALQAFQKAVNPPQAYCNLAFIYTTQGKREEAKAAYRQALALEPGLQLARSALTRLESPSDEARRAPGPETRKGPIQQVSGGNRSSPPAAPPSLPPAIGSRPPELPEAASAPIPPQ